MTKQKQKQISQSGKIVGDICATLMIKSFYFIIDFFKSLCSTTKTLYRARQKSKQIKNVNKPSSINKQSSINKDVTREMYIKHQKENDRIFDKKMNDANNEFLKNNGGGIY